MRKLNNTVNKSQYTYLKPIFVLNSMLDIYFILKYLVSNLVKLNIFLTLVKKITVWTLKTYKNIINYKNFFSFRILFNRRIKINEDFLWKSKLFPKDVFFWKINRLYKNIFSYFLNTFLNGLIKLYIFLNYHSSMFFKKL